MKNKLIHEMQRITSYISAYGLTIYETEQYNENSKEWYIVGDSYTDLKIITGMMDLHNMLIDNLNNMK
jgi:hypothetical protein